MEAFLLRADARTLPFPDKKARKSDVPDLQRAAFSAARASLKGMASQSTHTFAHEGSALGTPILRVVKSLQSSRQGDSTSWGRILPRTPIRVGECHLCKCEASAHL